MIIDRIKITHEEVAAANDVSRYDKMVEYDKDLAEVTALAITAHNLMNSYEAQMKK